MAREGSQGAIGLLQRGGRYRYQSALPGEAEQEQVAGDGVSQQGSRNAGRIDKVAVFGPDFLGYLALHRGGGKTCVRVENKRRGGYLGLIDYRMGATLGDLAHRLVGGGYHQVGAQQQVAQGTLSYQDALALAEQFGFPDWIDVDAKKMEGTFKSVPERSDLPADINESLVVELYSK